MKKFKQFDLFLNRMRSIDRVVSCQALPSVLLRMVISILVAISHESYDVSVGPSGPNYLVKQKEGVSSLRTISFNEKKNKVYL